MLGGCSSRSRRGQDRGIGLIVASIFREVHSYRRRSAPSPLDLWRGRLNDIIRSFPHPDGDRTDRPSFVRQRLARLPRAAPVLDRGQEYDRLRRASSVFDWRAHRQEDAPTTRSIGLHGARRDTVDDCGAMLTVRASRLLDRQRQPVLFVDEISRRDRRLRLTAQRKAIACKTASSSA